MKIHKQILSAHLTTFVLLLAQGCSRQVMPSVNYSHDSTTVDMMEEVYSRLDSIYATIGIPINKAAFDSLAIIMTNRMQSKEKLSVENCIVFVRVMNTIIFDNLSGEVYQRFTALTNDTVKTYVVNKLEGQDNIGMSYYFPRYNISFGGKPDSNSKYRIIR